VAFVKAFGGNNAASGTTIATASTAVGGANTLVVGVTSDSPGGVPGITVADGVNTFTQVGTTQNEAGNNQCFAMFIAENVTAGTRVITATYSVAKSHRVISVMEMSGRAAVSLDQGPAFKVEAVGSSATDGVVTTAFTPTEAGEDVVCMVVRTADPPATHTAGTNYVKGEDRGTTAVVSSEYRPGVPASSQMGTWTFSVADPYICGAVSLKAADPLGFVKNAGTGHNTVGVASLPFTVINSAIPVGAFLIVATWTGDTGGTPSASWLSDARGNVWQLDITQVNTGLQNVSLFSSKITTQLEIGDAVTVTPGASTICKICGIHVWGLDPTTWYDKGVSAQADNTDPADAGTTAALAVARSLGILSAGGTSIATSTSTASPAEWLVVHDSVGGQGRLISNYYRVTPDATALAGSVSWADLCDWAAVLGVYKGAAAASAPGLYKFRPSRMPLGV
jgi:hypothetical protein